MFENHSAYIDCQLWGYVHVAHAQCYHESIGNTRRQSSILWVHFLIVVIGCTDIYGGERIGLGVRAVTIPNVMFSQFCPIFFYPLL